MRVCWPAVVSRARLLGRTRSRFKELLLPGSGVWDATVLVSSTGNPDTAHLSNFLIDSMPISPRAGSWGRCFFTFAQATLEVLIGVFVEPSCPDEAVKFDACFFRYFDT